jgi:hypothetical protein
MHPLPLSSPGVDCEVYPTAHDHLALRSVLYQVHLRIDVYVSCTAGVEG